MLTEGLEDIENSFIAQAHGVLDGTENGDGPIGSVLMGFEKLFRILSFSW